jgi:carbon storage regulator CsrA
MLVLTRKKSEGIAIKVPPSNVEQTIHVMVVDVRSAEDVMSRKVRLGFEAEAEVSIWRDEVWEDIERETKSGVIRCPFPKDTSNSVSSKKR